jgi:hexosaminidase
MEIKQIIKSMFRKIAYISLFLLSSVIFAQSSIPVIPKPKFVLLEKAPSFLISKQTVLIAQKGNPEVQYLKEIIKKQLGFELATNTIPQKTNNCIELSLNPLQKMEIDEYKININATNIKIEASNSEGLFYGIQTLNQIYFSYLFI